MLLNLGLSLTEKPLCRLKINKTKCFCSVSVPVKMNVLTQNRAATISELID